MWVGFTSWPLLPYHPLLCTHKIRGWWVSVRLWKLEEWQRTVLHCQKLKGDVCLIALSQFYGTVCKMDMSVIMYCYCSFVTSGTALITWSSAEFLRTLLLTLDIEWEPTSPSSSRCRSLVYPGWSSTVAWSGMGFNADSRLSSVINTYPLDKQIDICIYRTFCITQKLNFNFQFVLRKAICRCGFTTPLILNFCYTCVGSFMFRLFLTRREISAPT